MGQILAKIGLNKGLTIVKQEVFWEVFDDLPSCAVTQCIDVRPTYYRG